MRAELSLTIMSLGGGVQSSVMALMASQSLPPTGSGGGLRPRAGLRHLRRHPLGAAQRLRARRVARRPALSFPLYVVDNGRSLREDLKALTNHSGSRSYVDIPVYLKGRGGEGDGIGRRQCTDNYKIRPIRRKIREMQGLRPRQRVPAGTTVELWLGMSTDEAIRMKTSRDRWITNRYPLMEKGMSRQDCADWWTSRYDRPLERSAPSSPVTDGWRPSAGGRSCSPRPWRSTPDCGTGWHSPKSRTCTPFGCLWPRRSPSTRRRWERTSRGTGSRMSARVTVGCERAMLTKERLGAYVDSCLSVHCCHQEDAMADQRQRRQ